MSSEDRITVRQCLQITSATKSARSRHPFESICQASRPEQSTVKKARLGSRSFHSGRVQLGEANKSRYFLKFHHINASERHVARDIRRVHEIVCDVLLHIRIHV